MIALVPARRAAPPLTAAAAPGPHKLGEPLGAENGARGARWQAQKVVFGSTLGQFGFLDFIGERAPGAMRRMVQAKDEV